MTVNRLPLKNYVALIDYVRTLVTLAGHLGANDTKVAKAATEKLGFPVSANQINKAREALDIPSEPAAGGGGFRKFHAASAAELAGRIKSLETQVASLQSMIRDLQVRTASVPVAPPGMGVARSNGIGSHAHN